MYFNTLSKSECCACTACEHVCHVKAISFVKDEEGFMYPKIDKNKCINCGLCERVCPIEHPNYSNTESPSVFAAMLKDREQRKRSSSGGMFFIIARWILEHDGIVYGATIDLKNQVKHIGVDNIEDLYLLRGSKYVQSNLQDVFSDIKQQLKDGRWCYFVGTGCQVAGLRSFLRKDFDNLITSDLVCHGVPSQWLFDQHIQFLEDKYAGKVSDYQFRNNETWGGCEIFNLTNQKGTVKHYKIPSYNLSPYLYSFMYGMTYRYSCYDCKFARIPRQGDVTLADFWGVKEYFPDIDCANGVSLVLANNAKGINILKKVKNECDIRESTINAGAKHNGNLLSVSKMHTCRTHIYNDVKEHGYAEIAKTIFRNPHYYSTLIKCKLTEFKLINRIVEWKNRKR